MPPLPKHKQSPKGFALFAVIMLMALMAAIAVSLLTLASHEKILIDASQKHVLSNHAAWTAAKIALGQLQQCAGTDNVITTPDSTGTHPWTIAHNVKNPPKNFHVDNQHVSVPLVSASNALCDGGNASFPNPKDTESRVLVPWEYPEDNLRIAYFITDESEKFPLRDTRPTQIKNSEERRERQQYAQISGAHAKALKSFSEKQNGKSPTVLEKAPYDPSFFFSENSKGNVSVETTTFQTRAVIANWTENELKKDLSETTFSDEVFPLSIRNVWKNTLGDSPLGGVPVAVEPMKAPQGKLGFIEHICPLITDVRLHIGFFNARSDGQHRARFHVTAKLWNPYAFPLLAHDDGQFGILNFSGMPAYQITNRNTDTGFWISLSDFPTGKFGLVRQTPSDKTFNAYCKIFDTTDQGFGTDRKYPETGLHAGEIYTARFPEPSGQPEGLSRITGGATWKFQKGNNPSKPPSGAVGGRWFHGEHTIEFFSLPSLTPTEITLQHYNGSFPQSCDPENYSDPILIFKNVKLPPVEFRLTGNEYNRQKAGEYNIDQANVVYRIRLKTEDENALIRLLDTIDLRACVFDFSIPEVAAAFEISAHTGEEARKLASAEDNENQTYFFDKYINKHNPEEATPAFSSIQIYDLPYKEMYSTSMIRLLYFSKSPPRALGRETTQAVESKINQLFDKYFFSAKKHSNGVLTSKNPIFVKKDLTMCPLEFNRASSVDFAEECMINAPFNINSVNEKAWKMLLTNFLDEWEQYSGRSAELRMPWDQKRPKTDFENLVFTRPFTAQFYSPDGKIFPMSDQNLEKAHWRTRAQYLLTQGLRSLPNEKVEKLSKNITKEIRERLSTGRYFSSIAEFVDSGIIERNMEAVKINEIGNTRILKWFPGYIRQEHIIQNFSQRIVPRGDTFKIYAQAEILNRITGRPEAHSSVEILVQRMPDLFDSSQRPNTTYEKCNAINRNFGRRFKILQIKYGID